MNLSFRDRREAEVLQHALERYEALRASGTGEAEARTEVLASLTPDTRPLFLLTRGMRDLRSASVSPAFSPAFSKDFAAKLRRAQVVKTNRPRVARRRPSGGLLALAAAIVVLAGMLVPAFRSLPGDPLYAIKRASENTRVSLVTGSTEANLRLDLAEERFDEVHRLIERHRMQALAPGTTAAGPTDGIDDPQLVALINETLADAETQISTAADILVKTPSDHDGLDKLVRLSHDGKKLAEDVAETFPQDSQSPALHTGVAFAKIEAQAKAARMQSAPAPTPEPCVTPMPSASPSDTSPEPAPTGEAVESPAASPSPEPSATTSDACATPSPEPQPSAPPETSASPEPSASTDPGSPPTSSDGENPRSDDDPATAQSSPAPGNANGIPVGWDGPRT